MSIFPSVAARGVARAVPRPDPGARRLPLRVRLDGPALGWLLPALALAAWQIAGSAGALPETVLPRPADVLSAAYTLTLTGELPYHLWISFWRAVAGFAVGGGLGFALGLTNGLSGLSERLTDTSVQMLRNIPHLAMIPLLIVWFGIGEGPKLVLVAMGVFFPVYVNTLHGIRSVDPQLIEMGRAYGMTRAGLFGRIILPGALPSIFVGIRFGLGIMWLTLIVAETIAAQAGIGYMAMQARELLQTDIIVLAILIYAGLGKLADVGTRLLERLCLGWHPAFSRTP